VTLKATGHVISRKPFSLSSRISFYKKGARANFNQSAPSNHNINQAIAMTITNPPIVPRR
jgi:hypothetical protein